ncbi:hypothetical protein BGX27_002105, partial [Mortierella sp. AM989]
YDAKIWRPLLQMGDKHRDNGDLKRAVKCYDIAKPHFPHEVQERLSLLPERFLSTDSEISTHHSFGNGYHRDKFKKIIKATKPLSLKLSLTDPFFPKGTHPSPMPPALQDTLTPQKTVCAFIETQDTNSVVTSYIYADEEIKLALRNHINDIIIQFDNSLVCLETVQELVILAKIPDKVIFLQIITQMLKVLNEKPLFAGIVLQGMAAAVNSCPKEINTDDMRGIYPDVLKSFKQHLETVRTEQSEHQLIPLLHALSALLNALVCEKVSTRDQETSFKPLIGLLDGFTSHDDTTVVFMALNAKQAIAHIDSNESCVMSIFRRARLAITIAGDIANGIAGIDLRRGISAYETFIAMCDFSVQYEWYLGLAYVDCILEIENWSAFEAFVIESKFKSDKRFLQGICLRLEQIAARQRNEIHLGAVRFLRALAASPSQKIQKTAQAALKRLEAIDGTSPDSKGVTLFQTSSDRSVSQACREDPPPIWDPIWHTTTRNTLLKAVQQRERGNMNLDEMPERLDDIKQGVKSNYAELTSV